MNNVVFQTTYLGDGSSIQSVFGLYLNHSYGIVVAWKHASDAGEGPVPLLVVVCKKYELSFPDRLLLYCERVPCDPSTAELCLRSP